LRNEPDIIGVEHPSHKEKSALPLLAGLKKRRKLFNDSAILGFPVALSGYLFGAIFDIDNRHP
jgi:hypothetical protein